MDNPGFEKDIIGPTERTNKTILKNFKHHPNFTYNTTVT